jgi:flavodoxin
MVVYYSWSGNTKAYAEELAAKKGLDTFQLKEKKERKTGKLAFIRGCVQGITRKQTKIVALPDISKCTEVFICTPVWASGPAPAIRYFLNHSDLSGKKVNFLFTCGGMTEPDVFQKDVEQLLRDMGCSIGAVYAFSAKFKQSPDIETVKKNIEETVK